MKIVNSLVVAAVLSTHVGAQTETCKTLDTENTLYVCPATRYCEWDGQKAEKQDKLRLLGYNKITWNEFDGNPLEDLPWSNISDANRTLLGQLRYTPETYNLCINHYTAFEWKELEELEKNGASISKFVREIYEKLGYNETSWDEKLQVTPEWKELDGDQKKSLYLIGHNKESWDGTDFLPWDESATYPFEISCDSELLLAFGAKCFEKDTADVLVVSELSIGGLKLSDFLVRGFDKESEFDMGVEKSMKENSGCDEANVTGKKDSDTGLVVDVDLITVFKCDGKCDDKALAEAVKEAEKTTSKLAAAVESGAFLEDIKKAVNLEILDAVTVKPIVFKEPVPTVNLPDVFLGSDDETYVDETEDDETEDNETEDDDTEDASIFEIILREIIDFFLFIIDFFYVLD